MADHFRRFSWVIHSAYPIDTGIAPAEAQRIEERRHRCEERRASGNGRHTNYSACAD
jgi:hypothetical protein